MSKTTAVSQGEENFTSTDSLDRLLGSMAGGPMAMDKLDAHLLDEFLNANAQLPQNTAPYVEIVEQPKQKELRFRYECEGRSAGSLPGQKSDLDRKTFPTIKVHNYRGPVKVVASLVTREKPPRPHPHGLVGKDCQNGVCAVTAQASEKMTISFSNLGIQCVKQKEVIKSLQLRQSLKVDPFAWFARSNIDFSKCKPKSLDFEMNVVCICFQTFIPTQENPLDFSIPLTPVVTHPIFDKKGATLHIARCDRYQGSVKGDDEIFILCDKVQRDDINVIFFSESMNWEAKALFGPNDIHRQVAIVCKTPKFKDLKITKPIQVQFMLRRPSDFEQSNPVDFTYTPFNTDGHQIEAKRKRKAANFEDYFKGPVNVKAETLAENQPSCSYSEHYGIAWDAAAATHMSPQPGGSEQTVRQKLRGKLLASNRDGLDVRLPPNDQALPSTSSGRGRGGRGRRGRTPKMAAQFNSSSSATNVSTVVASQNIVTQASAAAGLSTIDSSAIFSSVVLQQTTTAETQRITLEKALRSEATAMDILNSIQEGDITISPNMETEEDRAVQQILAQMPGPQGPAVQTVANPSSVIELNSAGNWQLGGVEVSKELADEIGLIAGQFMQTTKSGDLETQVDLTQLQDANMGEILISDPNSPSENVEMMVEDGGVHDSVSLPFSTSVELGASPPLGNSNEGSQ